MTFGKATAVTAGLLGAMAVGVWAGPYLTNRPHEATNNAAVQVSQPAATPVVPTKAPPVRRSRTSVAHNDSATSVVKPAAAIVPVSTPKLHKRLKPLLNSGANMALVAEGFHNAEDFAATVHASKNTNVPFMVLKHQVVDQGKSLKTAIHDAKPEADASLEADLARSEARSDLASLN
jgi:hypothetical protein